VTEELLPEFAFRHSAHDRLSDRRGDADFLEKAWTEPSTRVVVVRDLELAVASDGMRLATVSPEQAPLGQRMLLGQVEAGVMCPLSMTYAAIPSLRLNPSVAAAWEPRLLDTDPATSALCGMAMT